MSWKKHFRAADKSVGSYVTTLDASTGGGTATSSKFSSVLPEVYSGHQNRIQRYYQYADMDKDSDISIALTLIADFCTQSEEQSDAPFEIKYIEEGNETEIKLLKQCLAKWIKVNNFRRDLWQIFRETMLNGDTFFLRDPETHEWLWLDHFNVISVRVDEEKGKTPIEYIVRGLDLSRKAKYATTKTDTSTTAMGSASQAYAGRAAGTQAGGAFQLAGSHHDRRSGPAGANMEQSIIDAKHVVHLSLSIGMDVNWPFGKSLLESVYKVYKQKELLEDAIVIYRVTRAPERRVFKIDVGDIPVQKAQAHLLKVKTEMHQRRLPNRNGGTGSMVDSAYNPLAMQDDFFFAQTVNGRGSSVDVLPGGDALGEIGDLDYFTAKFARALGIPPSYLAINSEKSGAVFNDGQVGTALIQEFTFNKLCLRLQSLLEPKFDEEFKKFVEAEGVQVENDIFELRFNPPQNFSKNRQIEMDNACVGVYMQMSSSTRISERMKIKKYLGLSDDEILQNEEWWAEENPDKMETATGAAVDNTGGGGGGFGDIGIRSGGDDFGDFGDMPPEEGDTAPDGSSPAPSAPPSADPGAGGDAPPPA